MTVQLDQGLIERAMIRGHPDKLSASERIAANLFWRRKVPIAVISRVFGISKNTLYYRCLMGEARSYPKSEVNTAAETNAIVERLGVEEAWRLNVTDSQVTNINAAVRAYLQAREARFRKG